MLNLLKTVTRLCLVATVSAVFLTAAPVAAQETNELGLNEEQAVAYNNALEEAKRNFTQRKYRDAVNAYQNALAIYSEDFLTYYNMGVSYQGLNDQDSAVVMLQRCIELNPTFGRARLALATSFLKQNDLENAEKAYSSITSQMPDSIEYVMAAQQGLVNVALQYTNDAVHEIRQRDYDKAERYANRAVELAPDVHRPYYIAGMVQERKREYSAAERYYEGAYERAGDNDEKAAALNGIGRVEINAAKVSQRAGNESAARNKRLSAVEHLREAVTLDPSRSSGWVNLGNTLFELGRHAAARDALLRAQELDPRDHKVPFKLAETYMQLGDCQAAEAAASKAISLQRTNASAHAVRAEALECLDRKREAIDEYDAAARDPRWRQRANYKAKKLREELGL